MTVRTLADFIENGNKKAKKSGLDYPSRNWRALAQACNKLDISLRYNLRGRTAEYNASQGDPKGWVVLDDMQDSILQQVIDERFSASGSNKCVFNSREWRQCMHSLLFLNQIDPFKKWCEELEPWDGVPRIHSLLHDLFGAEDNDLSRWASACMFIAPVQRAFEPGALIRTTPVLIGGEGIGKTSLTFNILPSASAERWHYSCLNVNAKTESLIGCMKSTVIVELSEMAGIKTAPLGTLKGFLTQRFDRVRFPYARSESEMQRTFTFIGTANGYDVLPDDSTGNTRYAAIPLQHGCCIEEVIPPIRKQLWAEAVQRVTIGKETATMPSSMRMLQMEANSRYTNSYDDAMKSLLEEHMDFLKKKPRSLEEIAKRTGILQKGKRAIHMKRDMMAMLKKGLIEIGFESNYRRWGKGQPPTQKWAPVGETALDARMEEVMLQKQAEEVIEKEPAPEPRPEPEKPKPPEDLPPDDMSWAEGLADEYEDAGY